MAATLISPSGKKLYQRTTRNTTPTESKEAKEVRIKNNKQTRLDENKEYLKDKNVNAFLQATADAEGGGYDFKYGAIKGKKKDPWRFNDYSTHPGPGFGGRTTAAGMYQITIDTWRDKGGRMGLTDFSPETQDLIAVELLRGQGVIEKIKEGDISAALFEASKRWSALPKGPGLPNRYDQPYMPYEVFSEKYSIHGGTKK